MVKKKRGRPRKVVVEEPPKKKRGRPPKKKTEEFAEKPAKEEKPKKPQKEIPLNLRPHLFQKGQSGNPQGARLHSEEKKRFRAATDKEFAELVQLLINGDMDAIEAISDEVKNRTGNYSVMQIMTARVALKIIATGNAEAWEKFLTRTYGKPKENIGLDLTGLSGIKGRVTVNMPANGREAK